MRINIKTIPHKAQIYPTVGDWTYKDEQVETNFMGAATGKGLALTVMVSEMGRNDYEFLVAVHELIEAYLCWKCGITDQQVTNFDEWFEHERAVGNTDEPGDAVNAPYRHEHFFATTVERMLAHELGVDWQAYEKRIENL